MFYFQNFPKIFYDLSGSKPSKPIVVKNILTRCKILRQVLGNSINFYPYVVKDSDTPEIIASKYYDDPNRHWIVMFANDIIDPFYDWVLNYDNFNSFIVNKYGSLELSQTTIHHYEKIVTKVDNSTGTTTVFKYIIDEETYTALPGSETNVYALSNGSSVTITITKDIVYCYDYEFDANEAKRNIKIIDKKFIPQIEQELKNLLVPNGRF